MKLAFHQPNFLPNLGFFYKMCLADVFVVVSNIQFEKREGWQRRHKIRSHDGDVWLTVPVSGSQTQMIKEINISSHGDWRRKHRRALQLAYVKSREHKFLEKILGVYEQSFQRLVDLNMAMIEVIKSELRIKTKVFLDEEVQGKKEELMINICRKYGADTYLSGIGGKAYMTDKYYAAFNAAGIDYEFVEKDITGSYPYSSVHYLLKEGREKTKRMLRGKVRLAAYQPQYFPRLHYFARMFDADVFAFSDYVQYVRAHRYPIGDGKYKRGKSYQADMPIKTAQGLFYLTVPVQHQGLLPINKTKISYDNPWQRKHLYSIKTNYGGAKNFKELFPLVSEALTIKYASLSELNIAIVLLALRWLLDDRKFGLKELNLESVNNLLERTRRVPLRKIVLKSETDIAPPNGNPTEWIIDSCRKLDANEYVCGGTAASTYLEKDLFDQAGINLVQQEWKGAAYRQSFPAQDFIPNLSIIDLMMNVSRQEALKVLLTKS